MNFVEKLKTMFVEELDDEDVIKKKVIQVKIPNPEEKVVEKKTIPHVIEEDEEEETPAIEPVKIEEVKEAPKQPMKNFFIDDDFNDLDNYKPEAPKVIKQEYSYKKTETISPVITGYGIKRDEPRKKAFTPTPIISPVYGVLDKNYRKDEIRARKGSAINRNHDDSRVKYDDVRKKAYGTLEDELESELSSPKSFVSDSLVEDFMDEDNSLKEPIDIFEETKANEEDDFLSNFEDDSSKLVEDELNKDYDKYESEIKKSATKEYSDDDLFNLIDSMYRKKDGE